MKDKFTPENNDTSYKPLLYMALESTKGDVIEMGTGHGSTLLLHEYCKGDRMLYSYDEKEEWGSKFYHLNSPTHSVKTIKDWDHVINLHKFKDADVIFIDHAPGERRKEDILNFKNTKGIIVCHDTELGQADHGYQMRQHFPLFKYVVEVKTNGAWATALSNEYDLTKWIGTEFGAYKITEFINEPHYIP